VNVAAHDLRWASVCPCCGGERELQTRLDHACRALCDECAQGPYRPPSADGLSARRAPHEGPAA
jgi:hypothetical protein